MMDVDTIHYVRLLGLGIVAVAIGLFLMTGPIDGAIILGVAVVACGVAMAAVPLNAFIRDSRQGRAALLQEQMRGADEARQVYEQKRREADCDPHEWYFHDQGLDVDVRTWICRKCGAVSDTDPGS